MFKRTMKDKYKNQLGKMTSNKTSVEAWLKSYKITNYNIKGDGESLTIDVDGDVDLSNSSFKMLPDYIKFDEVKGNFYLNNNYDICILKGCPNKVDGIFYCKNCTNLISLVDCPTNAMEYFFNGCGLINEEDIIKLNEALDLDNSTIAKATRINFEDKIKDWLANYYIQDYTIFWSDEEDKYLIDVKGDADLAAKQTGNFPSYIQFNKIDGSFYCTNNNLTSLEGCPIEVGRDFYCYSNNLTSLEGAPLKCNSFYSDQFTQKDYNKYIQTLRK